LDGAPCPSRSPLDKLVAMLYRATCNETLARISEPREHSFIVAEKAAQQPEPRGAYCAYTLAKRELSTPAAAALLASRLGAPWIRVAGLKDAEATTLQLACLPCPRQPPAMVRVPGRLWARLEGRLSSRGR